MPILTSDQREQFIRDGYVAVRGVIPREVAASTREAIMGTLGIREEDPATWRPQHAAAEYTVAHLTEACRNETFETVVKELVGPHFLRGTAHSPYLESIGHDPTLRGFLPVLNYPQNGAHEFVPPHDHHVDGGHLVTTWPTMHFMACLAYLSDTPEYGGATAVNPGSHRQIFEHWISTGTCGQKPPKEISYNDFVPVPGEAGDVVFMHYLCAHAGSRNHSDHIRFGLNTAVQPDPQHPYERKDGAPQNNWTPMDYTLRTDNLLVPA